MKQKLNLVLWGALFFTFTQFLGIAIGWQWKEILFNLPKFPWYYFLMPFFASTLIYWFITKTSQISNRLGITKGIKGILKVLPGVIIGWAGIVIFFSFLAWPFVGIITAALIAAYYLLARVWFHNLCMVLLLAAFGAVFGSIISCWGIVILLAILALYDLIAVYKFKFMVELALETIRSQAVLGFMIPLERTSDFKSSLKEAALDFESVWLGIKPERFSLLGGGDVGLPLLLSVSVLGFGLMNSLIVAVFSIIGLIVVYCVYCSKRLYPIPALPFIASFTILGFLITLLI